MISFLLAGAIGLVSFRWTSGAWMPMAVAVAAISLLGDGAPVRKILAVAGAVACYNLGLILGLLLSYLQANLSELRTSRSAGSIHRGYPR